SSEAMDSWGWRLLFVLGAVLAALMVPLRSMMEETDTFKRLQREKEETEEKEEKKDRSLERSPLLTACLEQPRAIIAAVTISSIGVLWYFPSLAYVRAYPGEGRQGPNSGSPALRSGAAVGVIVATPLFGRGSDRFGRKPALAALMAVFV